MTGRKKPEIRFTLTPTIEVIDEESRSFWSRSASEVEKPVVSSSQAPKLVPYTPPDTLMFPLFSAIQRKDWKRAKRLCHELVLCDPKRNMYLELYVKLDQIMNLIDRRLHPQSAIRQATIPSHDDEEELNQHLELILDS